MDMKKLLEKMDQFAGQAVGQKPGDQVRGTDKATPKKSGKHPFDGRLVGASESKNLLADLEKELVEGAVKRGLKEEFEAFKEQGVAEGFEPGHREIERWATKSEENQKIYNAYIKAGKMSDEAYKQKDGAAHTGLQLRKNQIRDLIAKKMSEQGVAEGSGEIKIPTEDGITMQDIRLMAGEGPLTKKTILQAIAVIRKQRRPQGVAEAEENPQDAVSMDVPLLIRIMEYAREDAKTDMDLHDVAENLIRLSAEGRTLSMHDYATIMTGKGAEQADESLTPDNMHLDKASRVKAGDKIIYKGKFVGVATGEVADGKIFFKLVKELSGKSMNGIASLPIDLVSLREVADTAYVDSPGAAVQTDTHSPSPIGSIEEDDEEEEFGYRKLHPHIFKARQKYPLAKTDMEALLMYTQDQEHQDVTRIDKVNDREDAEINKLDKEEDYLQRKLSDLMNQMNHLKSSINAKQIKEEVPPAVATAGGPAGATQPKQTPPGQPVDAAQLALQKQQQSKMQQNLANLKTAGVQLDPAKTAQTLQKTDTGAPMNAMDKDNISKIAPAIGNVMANPSTATQLNTLIKKAGGGA